MSELSNNQVKTIAILAKGYGLSEHFKDENREKLFKKLIKYINKVKNEAEYVAFEQGKREGIRKSKLSIKIKD